MGRYVRLLGVAIVACGLLSGCDRGTGSSSLRLPTGFTPTPTPAPTPSPPAPPPASSYTVSGVVSELVAGQLVPLEGAHVEDSERHVFVKTAADGSYTLTEVATSSFGGAYIYFSKPGFRSQTRQFLLTGDHRVDLTLVRE